MNPLMETPKRESSPYLTMVAFWVAAITVLVNVNHFLNMTIGTGWPATLGFAICCILLCLVVPIPRQQVLGLPGFLILAALIFYLFIGLSVALLTNVAWYAVDPAFPLRIGLAILTVVATALGASVTLQQVGVERLLKGVLVILTATCLLILATPLLVEYVYTFPPHLRDLRWILLYRFAGTFANPNMAGIVCCYTVVLALSVLESGRHRMVAGVGLILGSTAGVLTFSRTVILMLAGIFMLFFLSSTLRRRQQRSFVVKRTISLMMGVAVLAVVNLEHLPMQKPQFERLNWINFMLLPNMLPRHVDLWFLSWSQITESPVFGHGIMRFHYLKDSFRCRDSQACGSHNSYLMLWGEAGIIPLFLFLLAIGSLLWMGLRLPEPLVASVVTGWTTVFALACLTADSIPYLLWHDFIIGLSCALGTQARRESRRRKLAAQPTFTPTQPSGLVPAATG